MKKSINEVYAISNEIKGTFAKGQTLVTVSGIEFTIVNVYSAKGRCAMYECVSDNENLNGFASSMEIKRMVGKELEVRCTGGANVGGRKVVSANDIPTMYKSYCESFNAIVEKLAKLNEKYHIEGNEQADEATFTNIWAKEVEAQRIAREQRIAKAKANNATTKALHALGIDLGAMSIDDATQAIANALKAMQQK